MNNNIIKIRIDYGNSFQINIRNLPSLTWQIIVKDITNFKNMCFNDDLSAIYIINEDGTQIQAIRG